MCTNLNTLYTHTYFNAHEQHYYFLSDKRKVFLQAIFDILAVDKNAVRIHQNTYYTSQGLVGDAAYIVPIDTFLKHFKGNNTLLEPRLR